MTVPDELVRAAADAIAEELGEPRTPEYEHDHMHMGRAAVAAVLRALPECEAAVWALIPGMPDALTYEEAQRKLAALAKLADRVKPESA